MAARVRTKKSKSSSLTVEMIEYFGGRHRPTPRELIPFTLHTLFDSLATAKDALLAPFPDLAEWPKSADEARQVIEKCAKWAAALARAFNADPNCGQPYGLQTHFSMQPGGQWAGDFFGRVPAETRFQIKTVSYRQYLEPCGGEPDYVAGLRNDLLRNWDSMSRSIYWQYRADRAAARRVLNWVESSLERFFDEELPRIVYVKPLKGRLHEVRVTLCGVSSGVILQDNLVQLLQKLSTGEPVDFLHRTFKQRLIAKIPSLANCILPSATDSKPSHEVTGAKYELARELVGRVVMKGNA